MPGMDVGVPSLLGIIVFMKSSKSSLRVFED